MSKVTNQDLANYIVNEGMLYACESYFDIDDLEDKETLKLVKKFLKAADELSNRLKKEIDIANEEF